MFSSFSFSSNFARFNLWSTLHLGLAITNYMHKRKIILFSWITTKPKYIISENNNNVWWGKSKSLPGCFSKPTLDVVLQVQPPLMYLHPLRLHICFGRMGKRKKIYIRKLNILLHVIFNNLHYIIVITNFINFAFQIFFC